MKVFRCEKLVTAKGVALENAFLSVSNETGRISRVSTTPPPEFGSRQNSSSINQLKLVRYAYECLY